MKPVRFRSICLAFALLFALPALSGCAQVMGVLRRDLDDEAFDSAGPTVGGRWAEGGFLAEDLPEGGSADRYVGHSDRGPASEMAAGRPGSRSWITPERMDANRRDTARGAGDPGDEEDSLNSDNVPNLEPSVRRNYKNGMRATRADFIDESQNEGSLWASDGQTNYYFTKNKIRGVGDIVSVTVEPDLLKDIGQDARRSLNPREREYELAAAQERLRQKALGLGGPEDAKKDSVASAASAPNRAPAGAAEQDASKKADAQVPQATYADVDVSKSLELKAGDQLMGEIIERYPNGNYKVRATKRIPYKGGTPRYVTLVGVVKGSDIAEDDTVSSGKLYEYRVETKR